MHTLSFFFFCIASSIFFFDYHFVMSCTSFSCLRPVPNVFSVKRHFLLTTIIIPQNNIIFYTSQCKSYTLSKMLKHILTIFLSMLLSTAPEMLNVIKLTMVFKIIHNQMVNFAASTILNIFFNLISLSLKIRLCSQKLSSTTS